MDFNIKKTFSEKKGVSFFRDPFLNLGFQEKAIAFNPLVVKVL
jgi:hypothetical protein